MPDPGHAALDAQKKTLIAREQDAAERETWRHDLARDGIDAAGMIFLDESSTPLTLTPQRARAPRGKRAVGRVPRGRWESITLVATVTPKGMGPALTMPGALDRIAFDTFVDQVLVPSLSPGQTVVLDNLSVHNSAYARQRIESAGCQLRFLPRYSPDFNPIELAFAKLKHHLRQQQARTFDTIVSETGRAMSRITTDDIRGFYRAAGYPL